MSHAAPTPGRGWRAQTVALVALAILATIAAAKLAAPLLVPVVLGVLASHALRPLVRALEGVRVPHAAGAVLVMAALAGATGASAWWLADDASAAVAEAQKFGLQVGAAGPVDDLRPSAQPAFRAGLAKKLGGEGGRGGVRLGRRRRNPVMLNRRPGKNDRVAAIRRRRRVSLGAAVGRAPVGRLAATADGIDGIGHAGRICRLES